MKTPNKSVADLNKQPATKADIAKLETGLRKDMVKMEAGLRKDMAEMGVGLRKDMVQMEANIRKDMATKNELKAVKDDVHVLKQDVSVLKQDVSALKTDMGSVKQSIGKLAIQTLKNTEDIEWIKENMVTKNDHNKVMTALDEVLHIVRRSDEERVVMNARLDRLDAQKADKTEVERLR